MPGGRTDRNGEDVKFLNNYYKINELFKTSLLDKNFIIYNQKAKDRVKIYLRLMQIFESKNLELINLLSNELKEN